MRTRTKATEITLPIENTKFLYYDIERSHEMTTREAGQGNVSLHTPCRLDLSGGTLGFDNEEGATTSCNSVRRIVSLDGALRLSACLLPLRMLHEALKSNRSFHTACLSHLPSTRDYSSGS